MMPSGAGPFPVLVVLAGCGARASRGGSHDGVQAELGKRSFLVRRVDSVQARSPGKGDSEIISNRERVQGDRVPIDYRSAALGHDAAAAELAWKEITSFCNE